VSPEHTSPPQLVRLTLCFVSLPFPRRRFVTYAAVNMRISNFASVGTILAVVNALTLPTSQSPYAPVGALCPSNTLVRPASGLSSEERAFIQARKIVADVALVEWLAKTNLGFLSGGVTLPTVSN